MNLIQSTESLYFLHELLIAHLCVTHSCILLELLQNKNAAAYLEASKARIAEYESGVST